MVATDPTIQTIDILDSYFDSVNGAIEEFISSGPQDDPDLIALSKQYDIYTRLYSKVKQTIIAKSKEGLIETGHVSVPPEYFNLLKEPLAIYQNVADLNSKIFKKLDSIPRDKSSQTQNVFVTVLKSHGEKTMASHASQLKMLDSHTQKELKSLQSQKKILIDQRLVVPPQSIDDIDNKIEAITDQIAEYQSMINIYNKIVRPAPPSRSAGDTANSINLESAKNTIEDLSLRFGLNFIIDVFTLMDALIQVKETFKKMIDLIAEMLKDSNVSESMQVRRAQHIALTLRPKTVAERFEEWRNRIVYPVTQVFGLLVSILSSAMAAIVSLIKITGGNPSRNSLLTAMSSFMMDSTTIFSTALNVFDSAEATTNSLMNVPQTLSDLFNSTMDAVNNTMDFVTNLPSNITSTAESILSSTESSVSGFVAGASSGIPNTGGLNFGQSFNAATKSLGNSVQSDFSSTSTKAGTVTTPSLSVTPQYAPEAGADTTSSYLNNSEF